MSKTNIFLVYTQYHLMLSVNIIFNQFRDYSNIIYIGNNQRITDNLTSNENFIEIIKLNQRQEVNGSFIKTIIEFNPERFFVFQEDNVEIHYLTYVLKKKNITICLGQDGNKPYSNIQKDRLFLSILRDNFNNYKFLIKNRLFYPTYGIYNKYKYATLKQIDELWLTHPESFLNTTKKKIVKNPDFSKESISFLVNLFKFELKSNLENVLLYIAKPLKQEYWQTEYGIFEQILQEIQGLKVLYKTHPNQSAAMLEQYKAFKNIELIYDRTPAEFYIFSARNSIFMGINSAAMITYNPSNKYVNISPFFTGGRYFSQYKVKNPVTHIDDCSNMKEIIALLK